MSRKDDALEDAEILARGGFRLDKRRAMGKLSHFQLEDPHRYVLELVGAAVRSGARTITIRNDSDDFEIEWDGAAPSQAELDTLFDYIFLDGGSPHEAMLHRLAGGIYGALGLDPAWIRLERPGLRIDLSDPGAPKVVECEREAGVFVHVRERFGWSVVREFMVPFSPAYEGALLKQALIACPADVVLNGSTLSSTHAAPTDRAVATREGIAVWLGVAPGHLIMHADGLMVEAGVSEGLAPLGLSGQVTVDGLKLNASRSRVVKDARWRPIEQSIDHLAIEVLCLELDAELSPFQPDQLEIAALNVLARRAAPPLAKRPLFCDSLGRRFSLAKLRSLTVLTCEEGLPDADLPEPQFAQDGTPRSECQLAAMRARGVTTTDATARLQERRQGRMRRQRLRLETPDFYVHGADTHVHDSANGRILVELKASVGVGSLKLWVDDLPCETLALTAKHGPFNVRAGGHGLEANPGFTRVTRNENYSAMLEAVEQACSETLRTICSRPLNDLEVAAVRQAFLDTKPGRLHTIDPPELKHGLDRAEIFETASGDRVSIRRICRWLVADGTVGVVEEPFPEGLEIDGAKHTLVLDMRLRRALTSALPKRSLRDRQGEFDDLLVRTRRRRALPLWPRLPEASSTERIHREGLKGLVALDVHAGPTTHIEVIHQGVPLRRIELDLGIPTSAASVSWDAALPDARWERLESAEQVSAIVPFLRQALIRQAVQRSRSLAGGQPLPRWLVGILSQETPPAELSALRLFPVISGPVRSLSDLEAMAAQGDRLDYVSQPMAAVLGHNAVLVLESTRIKLLKARALRLRGVDKRLQKAHRARVAFLERTAHPKRLSDVSGPTRILRGGDGLQIAVAVSTDASRDRGCRARVLAEGQRILCSIHLRAPLPLSALVWGPAVAPAMSWDALEGESRELVETQLRYAVDACIAKTRAEVDRLDEITARRVLTWLLDGSAHEEATAALRRRPIFRTLRGERRSLDDLEALHHEGHLTRAKRLTGQDIEPVDRRTCVLREAGVDALLAASLGPVPDCTAALKAALDGRLRRAELPTSPLAVSGRFLATWGPIKLDDDRVWLGVRGNTESQDARVDYLVDNREVGTERWDLGLPFTVRMQGPSITANATFTARVDDQTAQALVERVKALLPQFLRHAMIGGQRSDYQQAWVGQAQGASLTLFNARGLRNQLIRALRAKPELAEALRGVDLVQTVDGGWLDASELLAVAGRGRLRVVPDDTTGPNRDPDRPVLRTNGPLREALETLRSLYHYQVQIERDKAVLERMNATAVRPTERPPREVLLTIQVNDGATQGFVQLLPDGSQELRVYRDWRPLGLLTCDTRVPLQGALSHPGLRTNEDFTSAVQDAALDEVKAAARRASKQALGELVGLQTLSRALTFTVVRRCFRHRNSVPRPDRTSPEGRLAGRPLFNSQDGDLNARELADLRGRILWVDRAGSLRSPDPKRPFVAVPEGQRAAAMAWFGGADGRPIQEEVRESSERRSASPVPFRLPEAEWLSRAELHEGDFRAVVGIHPAIERPGELRYRVDGVPLQRVHRPEWPGVVAVIELDSKHASADFTHVMRPKPILERISRALPDLVRGLDAGRLARGSRTQERLLRTLGALRRTGALREAWLGLPLIPINPRGHMSLSELAATRSTLVIGAKEATEDSIALRPDPSIRPVLQAANARAAVLNVKEWRAQREAAGERERELAMKRRRERWRASIEELLSREVTGRTREALVQLSLEGLPTRDVEDERARWLTIWVSLDRALMAYTMPELAAELALRVGERLERCT